jgi:hypothetical protein
MQWMTGAYESDMMSTSRANYVAHKQEPVKRMLPVHANPVRETKFDAVSLNSQTFVKHPYSKAVTCKEPPSFFRPSADKFDDTTQYSANFQGKPNTPVKRAGPNYTNSIHTSGHKFVGESEAASQFVKLTPCASKAIKPVQDRSVNFEADSRTFISESKAQFKSQPNDCRRRPAEAAKPTIKLSGRPFEGLYIFHQKQITQIDVNIFLINSL